MADRRKFLKTLAGGSAGAMLAGLPAAAPGLPSPPAIADEAYWELVKAQFSVRPGLIMMNAANLCPSPRAVAEAVSTLTRAVDADASFQNRAQFDAMREQARSAIAAQIGADPAELAITRNTSEGNNTIVQGLELGPGDEVVIWDENHPTNREAWQVRARRDGFQVRQVSVDPTGSLIEPFLRAMGSATRVLSVSHLSNLTGVLLPAGELCAEARNRGVYVHLDGAQTFGSHVLDLHAIACDSYASSSHKWYCGPKEAGILYVRADRISEVWATDVGVGYAETPEHGARKFESLGQRDDACVAAMVTAAELHDRIGKERIEARVRELTEALIAGLQEAVPGISFSMPPSPRSRGGVVIFQLPGKDGREVFSRLYDEHGVAGAPTGGIRLSPHIYNTLADVHHAVSAVAALA
ncbi:MAG: aminotransferase class V-fold PLP-dependent enzyme [Rhodothermales bacterium]|nr:aminotransferase class V-fold PLP-dependent enzyme [Rhodothermales bacterium]MBO6778287.1 aminotransferase class V-fold PLP-dependent enzyme [Rhodothermales bacterium]